MTEAELTELFSEFGKISSVKINKDEKGNSKCEGFVCFVDSTSAEDAVKKLNKKPLGDDKFLIV